MAGTIGGPGVPRPGSPPAGGPRAGGLHTDEAPLPIDAALPALIAALAAQANVVLAAPPGSGKSTRAPLALLAAPAFAGQQVLLLEPRRVAARAIAQRLAMQLGERVGETVGYRIRQDTRVGPDTRLTVITEGILTRMLQHDPELPGVGLVLFDEFHERSLHSDLGLALALDAQRHLRPDLRLLVMSATLDLPALTAMLGGAPVIDSAPTEHRVDVRWLGRPDRDTRIETAVADAVLGALAEPGIEGDVLVFLPGAGEIERARTLLAARLPATATAGGGTCTHIDLVSLYGELTLAEQERALAPAPPGRRKVVLATDIAQTSLTLPGVRIVVDAGLARVPRFDPGSGMSRLETVNVSRASATQRAGRAGRVADGLCLRLWSKEAHERLAAHDTPEILQSDLAPLVLELAAWGAGEPRALDWLDPPNEAAWAQGRALLQRLHALDADGRITAHGRALLGFGTHPRLAHMLVRAAELTQDAASLRRAADIAALLEDRDPLRRGGIDAGVDLEARLHWLAARGGDGRRQRLRDGAARHVERLRALQRARRMPAPGAGEALEAGDLLALAYPDRVALRRGAGGDGGGRYLLANGRGAVLPDGDALARRRCIAIADLDGAAREARVRLAAALDESTLARLFAEDITRTRDLRWDDAANAVQVLEREMLGALVLRERRPPPTADDAVLPALLDALRRRGIERLPWGDAGQRLRQRLAFLHACRPQDWPAVDDDALAADLETWLGPWLTAARRLADVEGVDLAAALLAALSPAQRQALPRLAPTHVEVPSGSHIPIAYDDPARPVLAVRIQEVFGLARTPTLLDGAVPLTLHLLSPAHRPMQVTQDLASFWANGYAEVRKDLRARYPRHAWPDDPTTAPATRRAKPRGT